MYDDEGQVEADLATVVSDGEVATVHRQMLAILLPVPPFSVDDNLVDVVFGVVKLAIHLVSAGDADVVLAAETAHDKCYILLHAIRVFFRNDTRYCFIAFAKSIFLP